MQINCLMIVAMLVVGSVGSLNAEDWVQWRGPTGDGVASARSRPPLNWDAKTNIAWKVEIPGEGSATPIVLGDQVFVLSAEKTDKKSPEPVVNDPRSKTPPAEFFYRFLVTSIDRRTGAVRWQQLATEQVPHEGRHETNTYAAGSPTTDGERLYVSFGSRGIFCYNIDGTLVWKTDLGDMRTRFGWGEAVTPVLADDYLIVNWDQEENSFIVALDKRTGQKVWKVERPGEVSSWNTPFVTTFEGKKLIVVNGTGSAKAYDAKTGEVLWACGGQTVNAIPSPIRFRDNAICMSGYRGNLACSIPLNSRGDITGKGLTTWQLNRGTPYVPSPVISGERLFFTGANSDVLNCVDAGTGRQLVERKRLGGDSSLYASPIVANGHLYFTGRLGTTVVVKNNENLDIVAVNALDDAIDASPVAVDNQLFLRSWKTLYCIESQSSDSAEPEMTPDKKSKEIPTSKDSGMFKQVDLEPNPETSANVSIGDLNGDGSLDLVLAKGRHWPLHNRVLLNNGKGEFPTAKDLGETADRTYSAAMADLDGDGDLDLVVSNDKPDIKRIYLNDGKANFKASSTWGEPTWNTRNTSLADLDGDGFPDLIVANRMSSSFICINDGIGNFDKKPCLEIPSQSATTIVPADINGDGLIDLVIPHRDGGHSQVFFNDGKMGFAAKGSFGLEKCFSRAAAAGDLNGDGKIDLIVGDERRGLFVCLNDGTGSFPESSPMKNGGGSPYAIAIADINSDKKPDAIVGYTTGPGSLFINDGTGLSFEKVEFGDGKGTIYGIAVGDLNSDGKPDIAVGRSDAPNAIFLNIK